ncbi:unnamed protein product [Oikopleura dioica]|uniref:Uncharacterized protein n=1 Tax=Oikopleura dioica TaxID=34765 RepID=E4XT72_OIKDI|nr:unnamed protein product [Oikopleura dioica]
MGDSGFHSNDQIWRLNEQQARHYRSAQYNPRSRTIPMTQAPRPQMIQVDCLADQAQQMSLNPGQSCQHCITKDEEIRELKRRNIELEARFQSQSNFSTRNPSMEERPAGIVAQKGSTIHIDTFYGAGSSPASDARLSSARSASRSSSNSDFEHVFRSPNN